MLSKLGCTLEAGRSGLTCESSFQKALANATAGKLRTSLVSRVCGGTGTEASANTEPVAGISSQALIPAEARGEQN